MRAQHNETVRLLHAQLAQQETEVSAQRPADSRPTSRALFSCAAQFAATLKREKAECRALEKKVLATVVVAAAA